MDNSLLVYLNKRLKEESYSKSITDEAGPLITISREVGCNGLMLAQFIAKRLNKHKRNSDWKVLSKEIFYQSAKELDLEPEHVRRTLKKTDKYIFDEILKAFNDKQFKSERKIIKTVTDAIRSFSIEGHSIIVGRAGHIIAKDIRNALHIRLVAPLEFRINNIMAKNKLNHEEAILFIKRVEKERIAFRKTICNADDLESYDICINRAAFNNNEIVDIIEYAADKKNLLNVQKKKMEFY